MLVWRVLAERLVPAGMAFNPCNDEKGDMVISFPLQGVVFIAMYISQVVGERKLLATERAQRAWALSVARMPRVS
jgi:hypothetical protein